MRKSSLCRRLAACLVLGVPLSLMPLAAQARGTAHPVRHVHHVRASKPLPVVRYAAAGTPLETGTASYYGGRHHGRPTASGVRFNQEAMTAAHPYLPFGTRVRVTLGSTGRSVVVVINDRLRHPGRIIDLSTGAARNLGMINQGLGRVSLTSV
jgi:rare lipoprotein A